MKFRIASLLLVIIMMLGMVVSVNAQDGCFGLSADDCAIIQGANANMANVTSFNQSYLFSLSVTGISALDPTASDLKITSDGNGPIVLGGEGQVPLSMQMLVNGAVEGPESQSGSIEFVITGDKLYLNVPGSGSWVSVDLVKALESQGATFDPAQFDTAMSGLMSPEAMAGLAQIASIPGFITYERLADENGNIPFSLTIDVTKFLQAPEFQSFSQGMTQADPNMGMIGALLPMLLSEGTINVTQWVSPDNFITKMSLDINGTIDASAMNPQATSPIVLDLHFEVTLSDINGSFNIVAPEGAIEVDPNNFSLPGQ